MKRTNLSIMLIIFAFAIFGSTCEDNKVLKIQPDAQDGCDAFIEDWPNANYSNRNFGNHPEFQASAFTAQGIPLTVRSLIRFDLSQIPVGTKISSAHLYLFSVDNTVNGPGHFSTDSTNSLIIQKVTSHWDEQSVSWNTQPATTSEGQIVLPPSDSINQNYAIDVTLFVQEMVNDPQNNFGFMMRMENEEFYRKILFASSDYPDDASKHPALVIRYKN